MNMIAPSFSFLLFLCIQLTHQLSNLKCLEWEMSRAKESLLLLDYFSEQQLGSVSDHPVPKKYTRNQNIKNK